MSDKEIKKEKVVTKYDLKVQRRKEEQAKEQRQKKIGKAVGVVVVIALIAWIASFPIRTYMAVHETFVTINGEKITRAEFDYNYNNTVNNYMNMYSVYLGYMGLDTSRDLSTQMYSETMTWQDFFEEMTVDNLKKSKALKAEADAAGYTFDAGSEIAKFKDELKEAAKDAGASTGSYLKQIYGRYASMGRVSDYIAEDARINAYYEELSKGMEASEEEIQAYYQENTDDYDSVDYYLSTFSAQIPEDQNEEGIAVAMDEAHGLAEAAEKNIMTEGELQENRKKANVSYLISNWLFDEARKKGDTTVIEDVSGHMYYVLGFVDRYLDEALTADARIIITQEMDGQAVLDEWTAGGATEEGFAGLCDQYSAEDVEGGLYEGLSENSLNAAVAGWIFADERKAGDTGYVTAEDGYTYVMYYVGQGDPEWKVSIGNTLLYQAQQEYTDSISENVVVEDPKGNLRFLQIRAEEEAAAESESVSDGNAQDTQNSEAQ